MKQKNVILFDHVSKTYLSDFRRKPTQALSRVSFAVKKGEIFGIIGANGAGKSTSIKILMGFTACSKGKVTLNNSSPRSNTAHQGVGYLPENPCLYDNLTVTEHLQFAAKVISLPPKEANAEIDSILRRVELHKVAEVPIRKFSKGMTQRAALAYALIGSPKILILDEPMSGLDPLGRQIVLDIIQEQQQEGRTVLFCSHILTDVERICSKIAIMNQGQLVATLTPDQLSASNETTDQVGHSPLESYFLKTITPQPMNNLLAIATITFKEGLRNRLLYGILIFAILLMTFSLLFSGLFMRDIVKVILDFCLSAVNIGGLLIPFFLAINLLSKDIERKTIFSILAKPISRSEYLLGKYFGLLFLIGLIMFILLGATLLTLSCSQLLYADYFFTTLSYPSIISSAYSSFLGIAVLTSLVVLWSSISTSSFLVTLLTLATYLIGHTIDEVVRFVAIETPGVELSATLKSTTQIIKYIFPNLAAFDLKLEAAHGSPIPLIDITLLSGYATVYIIAALTLSTLIFSRRDLG